jgi:hypothetical protein
MINIHNIPNLSSKIKINHFQFTYFIFRYVLFTFAYLFSFLDYSPILLNVV